MAHSYNVAVSQLLPGGSSNSKWVSQLPHSLLHTYTPGHPYQSFAGPRTGRRRRAKAHCQGDWQQRKGRLCLSQAAAVWKWQRPSPGPCRTGCRCWLTHLWMWHPQYVSRCAEFSGPQGGLSLHKMQTLELHNARVARFSSNVSVLRYVPNDNYRDGMKETRQGRVLLRGSQLTEQHACPN